MTPTPSHYTIGATYRDVGNDEREPSGFVGVAVAPDRPVAGRTYTLTAPTAGVDRVIAVGPAPDSAHLWIVRPDDGGPIITIDRGLLPLSFPRVGLYCEVGPKGAPERRYFDITDLELIADTPED